MFYCIYVVDIDVNLKKQRKLFIRFYLISFFVYIWILVNFMKGSVCFKLYCMYINFYYLSYFLYVLSSMQNL